MRTRQLARVARFLLSTVAALAFATPGVVAKADPIFKIQDAKKDPQVVFTLYTMPAKGNAVVPGDLRGNLTVDGQNKINQLYGSWWWYRLPNQNATAFAGKPNWKANGVNSESMTFTISKGVTAKMTWSVVAPFGGNAGALDSSVTITNTTKAPVTLSLFNYLDTQLGAQTFGESAKEGPKDKSRWIEITSANNWTARYIPNTIANGKVTNAWANVMYDVQAYPKLFDLLNNNYKGNFADTGLPFGPGDWTGAYEWEDLTIKPGARNSLTENVNIRFFAPPNGNSAPEPSTAVLAGFGLLGIVVYQTWRRRRRGSVIA